MGAKHNWEAILFVVRIEAKQASTVLVSLSCSSFPVSASHFLTAAHGHVVMHTSNAFPFYSFFSGTAWTGDLRGLDANHIGQLMNCLRVSTMQ